MVGAYAAFLAVAVIALIDLTALPLSLTLVLLAAAAVGAVHGLATERVVFRPLRHARSQAPLIATIGLAILLQEYLRLPRVRAIAGSSRCSPRRTSWLPATASWSRSAPRRS